MKKTLVAVGILAGTVGVYAQGQLDWVDPQRGFAIAIISPDLVNSSQEYTGNTIWDTRSAGTTYTGGWIGGTAVAPGGGVGPPQPMGLRDLITRLTEILRLVFMWIHRRH